MLELANDFAHQPNADRDQEHQPIVVHDVIAHGHQQQCWGRQLQFKLVEHFLKRRHDEEHNPCQNPDCDDHNRDGIDHRSLDFSLERFRPFEELGQALQNGFQRTARLARFHHVHVQTAKHLRALGHRFGQGRTRLNLIAYVHQRVLELARLRVVLQNFEGTQNRKTRVLQNR